MRQPPKLATKIFEWLCGTAFIEDLKGDVDELFLHNVASKGLLRAQFIYWKQILSLGFSYSLKKRKQAVSYSHFYSPNRFTMLSNYLKISVRNLKNQKAFTLLNIIGLSMGMSIAVLALAMLVELHKFDEFHQDAHRIYRINTIVEKDGNKEIFASTPPRLSQLLTDQVPQLESSVMINDQFSAEIQTDRSDIRVEGYITEPLFLETFDFPLQAGSRFALNEPNSVIITAELASKIFGETSALNQTLPTEKWGQLKVGGVLATFPERTHFMFDLLIGPGSISGFKDQSIHNQWTNFYGNYCYFKLAEGYSKDKFLSQVESISAEGANYFNEETRKATYRIQSLQDINPSEDIEDETGCIFERSGFWLFFGISLLILLPACFNYINMSVARALKRSKEIGIRKVLGSQRRQIIEQFLVETTIVALISTVLAVYIFQLIKIEFTSTLAAGSALSLDISFEMVLVFLLFALVTGLLTGAVPALYFAKISPLSALKSSVSDGKVSISGIRKGLLIAQFALTLIFMIGIGALLQQYRHSLTYNLGFSKENVLVIPFDKEKQELFRTELMANPDVNSVSFSSSIPGTNLNHRAFAYFEDLQDSMRFYNVDIDDSFIANMNLRMKWGTPPTGKGSQIPEVAVNEEFMKDLKLINPEADSLLVQLHDEKVRITGVVVNYNHEPLNSRIYPMMLRHTDQAPYALVSIASSDLVQTMSSLETSWDRLFPNQTFAATFLQDEIEKAYDFFRVALKIFGFLAFLAITISSLGLLGMVIYATENRTKEVAVRKILGANKFELLKALAGMFFKLWAVAIAIGIPIAYVFYDFALIRMYNKFSEGVGFIEIALSVLITVGLGTSAILWQTNKIIRINPAINLRNE
ncbi:MAG: FtsX-like permease family protein [Marinoscillum sp.]